MRGALCFACTAAVLIAVIRLRSNQDLMAPLLQLQQRAEDLQNSIAPQQQQQQQQSSIPISPVPTGLRLVMMGDSLSRYQYISLVYFLKNGVWIDPNKPDEHNLVREKSFPSWNHFYNATSHSLAPMEYCDCYRPDTKDSQFSPETVENRYFYDRERDNRVIFLTAFGHTVQMHGRWKASFVMSLLSEPWQSTVALQGRSQPQKKDFLWKYKNWAEAIDNYVNEFGAKYVMFNAGWWMNQFHNVKTRTEFVDALHKHDIQPIWKSTNYDINHTLEGLRGKRDSRILDELCGADQTNISNTTQCIDLRWTQKVASRNYEDLVHFLEPVYRTINEELLEMMGHSFPETYTKQSRAALSEG